MRCDCDWCPDIPSTWKQVRIKDIAILKSGDSFTAEELSDDGKGFPVYGGNGLRGYTDKYNKNGDYVLIGRQGALCGNINYAHGKFFATEHALVVNTFKKQNTTWLGETLRCADYNRLSQSAAQPGLAASVLMNQFIPYPPREVREQIGFYLDDKMAKIDKAVSLLQKKRDAYTRLKSSIINRAVTRGLNPNVKLKDSGVEWIGMIPENWEVKRIKDIANVNQEVLSESTDKSKLLYYIDISSVNSDGEIHIGEPMSFGEAPSRARRIIHRKDIVISTVRTYLKAIGYINSKEKDLIASTGFAVLSCKKNISSKFIYYAVRSNLFVDEVCKESIGVSYPAITASSLSSIGICLPILSEQLAIASYLNTHCSRIDRAISIVDKQIDAYTRLKKSLINEVVTGKRKV